MAHIREYTPADLEALREMHARQGFDYDFPNLADPIFVSRLVLVDDGAAPGAGAAAGAPGRPVMAALARLTAEMYLLFDPRPENSSPHVRWQRFLALHAAAERDLYVRGLDDAHCWLPPRIAKSFGRRLARLGWVRDDGWTPYCRHLAPGPAARTVSAGTAEARESRSS